MLYGQVTGSESLRDLETGFNAHRFSHYHMGVSEVHRSTLADANEKRPWQIYMQLFHALLGKFKGVKPSRPARIANKICTWDSTMIELCLSVFDWARFRRTKGAIKLHVKYDHGHSIPTVFVVTDGKTHDLTVARRYPVEKNSVLVMDRAYTDFAFLNRVDQQGAFFVTRLKSRIRYTVLERRRVNRKQGITSDQTIRMTGRKTRQTYPGPLRRIRYVNPRDGKVYVFLTNNFTWAASTIARLYKCRWQVELFFKWIKQHLKVKTFLGTSLNAVMTQICIAMIVFVLVALIKHRSQSSLSMLQVQRKIKSSLFHRLDLSTVIHGPPAEPASACENQLLLNLN
jgi:putative transposase